MEDLLIRLFKARLQNGILILKKRYLNVEINSYQKTETNMMFFIKFGSEEGLLQKTK